MAEDRIDRLSERFRRHEKPPTPPKKRNRGRRSFYVDLTLVERLDETYLALRHQLYPQDVSKSEFLEALLEFGLENLDNISRIIVASDGEESPDTSPRS